MPIGPLLAHLRADSPPLRLARSRPLAWDDEALHQDFYAEDPELYGLCALASGVHPAQRARALLQILRASRKGLAAEAGACLDRVVALLMALLPADDVLTVFLALRKGRANHRHTSRAILHYIFHHPAADSLLACRRASLAACVEHAVGRRTALAARPRPRPAAAAPAASSPPTQAAAPAAEGPVAANEVATDGPFAALALAAFALAGVAPAAEAPAADARAKEAGAGEAPAAEGHASGAPPLRGLPDRGTERSRALWGAIFAGPSERAGLNKEARRKVSASHVGYLAALDPPREHPKTINATNRGDIAATLVHLYRGGDSDYLRRAAEGFVDKASASMPRLEGKIALVLDASQSTRGYGEREFCCISQSVALARVLSRCCPGLRIFQVGGAGDPPLPQGTSDLAAGLLRALGDGPDVVVLVSDGYENRLEGDLALVVASLPAAGITTPILFAHSKFTAKDDLSLRRPAPALPSLEFWHEDDFPAVLAAIGAHLPGDWGAELLRQQLVVRLTHLERELRPWTMTSSPLTPC